ncbi:MAG: hypothetical protein PQJ44_03005 [Sphaerochaetaceae bacterium]|nr:hypothetical protein [Sphaerochaetaceae bacterium]
MFWHYLFYSILIAFGLFVLIKPNLLVEISKYSKRGLDESGKKRLARLFQILGLIIIITSLLLMFEML